MLRRCSAAGGHYAPESDFDKKADGKFKASCKRHIAHQRAFREKRKRLAQEAVVTDSTLRYCSATGGHAAPKSDFGVNADGSLKRNCKYHSAISNKSSKKRYSNAINESDTKDGERTCIRCFKKVKPEDAHKGGGLRVFCSACHDSEIARWKAIGVRRRIRARLMLTVPCEACGESRVCALQHAHRDRATKRADVPKCRGPASMNAECAKTRPLCVRCHMEETIQQRTGGRIGQQRLTPEGTARIARVDAELLGDRFHGTCQFPGCMVVVKDSDPLATRRTMFWVVRDPRDAKIVGPTISQLVTSDIRNKLPAGLALRVPVCAPHHEIIKLYRIRADPLYVIDKAVSLPQMWVDAEAATVANPDAYTRVLELPILATLYQPTAEESDDSDPDDETTRESSPVEKKRRT